MTTFDAMGSCDRFDQRTLPYDLNERFPLVSLLVEVSDVPGGERFGQWDVNSMLPGLSAGHQWK